MQAGDPGCIYNQHVWDEVVENARKADELVVLGQHDRVDSFLAGATDGALTAANTGKLVRDTLCAIADSVDPSRGV